MLWGCFIKTGTEKLKQLAPCNDHEQAIPFCLFFEVHGKKLFCLQVLPPMQEREVENWIVPSIISSRENELQAYQQNTDRGRPSEAEGKWLTTISSYSHNWLDINKTFPPKWKAEVWCWAVATSQGIFVSKMGSSYDFTVSMIDIVTVLRAVTMETERSCMYLK